MAIPNPEHYFDQADKLIAPPTEVDLRRAVSAAYYGLFHATVAAAADWSVGRTNPLTVQYKKAYRSVEHWQLKALCKKASKQGNFGPHILAFATEVVQLQQKRTDHDYDPLLPVTPSGATMAVKQARDALQQFYMADPGLRDQFLDELLPKSRP